MAGRASGCQMATRNTAAAGTSFAALVARYPETPNVHYANGVYLLAEQPDKAIEEFKKELEIQPGQPQSLMQIAFEYLNRGDARTALSWARQAESAAPRRFRGAQGAWSGTARYRRRRRRDRATPDRHHARAREARACTSRWRARIRRRAVSKTRTRSARSSTRLDRLARETTDGPAIGGRHRPWRKSMNRANSQFPTPNSQDERHHGRPAGSAWEFEVGSGSCRRPS